MDSVYKNQKHLMKNSLRAKRHKQFSLQILFFKNNETKHFLKDIMKNSTKLLQFPKCFKSAALMHGNNLPSRCPFVVLVSFENFMSWTMNNDQSMKIVDIIDPSSIVRLMSVNLWTDSEIYDTIIIMMHSECRKQGDFMALRFLRNDMWVQMLPSQ